MYKAEIITYSPRANDMAEKAEQKANEMEKEGLKICSISINGSAKGMLVFHKEGLKKSLQAVVCKLLVWSE